MSEHQWPGKNNIVITDEGDPNEAPETPGGASIEISGSSSFTSDQVGENNRAETDRDNNTVGALISLKVSWALVCMNNWRLGVLLTCLPCYLFTILSSFLCAGELGYGASTESSGSSSLLASGQVGENNHSEAARANDNVGNVNLLEGIIDVDLLED